MNNVQAASLDEATAIRLGLEQPAVDALLTARLDKARGALLDSGRWSNPEIQYSREGVNGLGGDGAENIVVLSQSVDFSGQLELERTAARKHLVAETYGTDAYRRELVAEIRNRFYEILVAERAKQIVKDWITQLEKLQVTIDKRVAAGDASRYESHRISQEKSSGPVLLAEINTERDAANERLAGLIGADKLDRYESVTGVIMPGKPVPLEQAITQANQRPDLRRLREQVTAYSLERDAARKSAIPDVTLSMGVRNIENDFNGNDNGLLLSASVPLPLFNRNEGDVLRASGLASEAMAEHQIQLQRIHAEVRAAYQRLIIFREAAAEYQTNTLAQARDLKKLAEISYTAGEIGILELIDAYKTTFNAERQVIELKMKARRAEIELNRLTGEEWQ